MCTVSDLPACHCLLTITLASERVAYPMLFGCVSNTDLVSHLLASGCGTFLWYLSKPMSAPPFHSSLLLSVIPPSFSFLLSHDLKESSGGEVFQNGKIVVFFSSSPSVSLVSFSLSQISIEKEKKHPKPQCPVTHSNNCCFNCIKLLFSLTPFLLFFLSPVQCGIWATCELGPFSEKAGKKPVTSERERKRGI